ncbi:MAG: M24 family metallopeptidase, partial [Coriobacteriaceae bacterium]|jgi:Xaa-Pro aminopeptidase|nr:M24 family metallopeptidase [Coriobacteriaceae bacterium]
MVLGIEDELSLAEYRKLEAVLKGQTIKETSKFVLELRAVKDADEVRRLKAAQAITDAAFAHIVSFIKAGMSEREVKIELEDFMLRQGAEGLAFSSIVATGANGASPHAIAGQTKLEAGQALVLDFGAQVSGYCSDMTRTVFIGEPSARILDAYVAVRQANEEVEAQLKPGVSGAEMQKLAEDILAAAGFEGAMGHSLGHGVGIDVHEEPLLAKKNTVPLEEGNVVTVEPGVYFKDEFGIRLEDFGIITRDGFEVFTQSSHDMVII